MVPRLLLILLAFCAIDLVTGCGGHTTFGSRAGVYLSTANAWNQVTVIRLARNGAIQGNTYASIDDADRAIADDYQPDTGDYTGTVVGSATCADPPAPISTCTMTLKITEQDGRSISLTGPARFTLDGLSEQTPSAIWTEVA